MQPSPLSSSHYKLLELNLDPDIFSCECGYDIRLQFIKNGFNPFKCYNCNMLIVIRGSIGMEIADGNLRRVYAGV